LNKSDDSVVSIEYDGNYIHYEIGLQSDS